MDVGDDGASCLHAPRIRLRQSAHAHGAGLLSGADVSELIDKGHDKRSLRYARDLIEHPGKVLTKPWWPMPGLVQDGSELMSNGDRVNRKALAELLAMDADSL